MAIEHDDKPKKEKKAADEHLVSPLAAQTSLTHNPLDRLMRSMFGDTAEEYAGLFHSIGVALLGIGHVFFPGGPASQKYQFYRDGQKMFANNEEIERGEGFYAKTIAWADEAPARGKSTYNGTTHASYDVKPRAGEVSQAARETFTRVASTDAIPDAPERQYAPDFNPIG